MFTQFLNIMESGFIIAKSHIFIIAIDVIMPTCLIGIE